MKKAEEAMGCGGGKDEAIPGEKKMIQLRKSEDPLEKCLSPCCFHISY
jgi:hypothetical protein